MKNIFIQTPEDEHIMNELRYHQSVYSMNLKIINYINAIISNFGGFNENEEEIRRLSNFLKVALETSNKGLDQEWILWEEAYVSDSQYFCQIINEEAFAKFLHDRWTRYKKYFEATRNAKSAYEDLVKTFNDIKYTGKLPDSIKTNTRDVNFVYAAYSMMAQYAHLYSPAPEQFVKNLLSIFNIFNKDFMLLFEDPDRKVVKYSYLENENGRIEPIYSLSVPNLIAATKNAYDEVLRMELKEKEEETRKKQENKIAQPARNIDFDAKAKAVKKWNRVYSESGTFIVGDVKKLLPHDIKYLKADDGYYMFCCQIMNDDEKIVDIRLPGVIYNTGFYDKTEKQLFYGRLNTYPSSGEIGIIPIEATDYDKLQIALENGSVFEIDNDYLLTSFEDNVLLIANKERKIIEAIDCENRPNETRGTNDISEKIDSDIVGSIYHNENEGEKNV